MVSPDPGKIVGWSEELAGEDHKRERMHCSSCIFGSPNASGFRSPRVHQTPRAPFIRGDCQFPTYSTGRKAWGIGIRGKISVFGVAVSPLSSKPPHLTPSLNPPTRNVRNGKSQEALESRAKNLITLKRGQAPSVPKSPGIGHTRPRTLHVRTLDDMRSVGTH